MNLPYDEYYSYLKTTLFTHIIIAVAVCILVLVPLIWSFVKKEPLGVKIIFSIFFAVVLVASAIGTVPYYMDISNEDIITYSGRYYVSDILDKSPGLFATVELSDGTSIECDINYCIEELVQQQVHYGTIVYSKRTLIMFYWD